MSRFSKKEAEARGYVFVHEQKESVEHIGPRAVIVPGLVRVEKYLPNGHKREFQAESIGKVLEQIHAAEARDGAFEIERAPIQLGEDNPLPLNEAGIAQRTVLTADGPITDEEFSARDRLDVRPTYEAQVAAEKKAALKAEAENARAAGEDIAQEQVVIDTTQEANDGPGTNTVQTVRGEESEEATEEADDEAVEEDSPESEPQS